LGIYNLFFLKEPLAKLILGKEFVKGHVLWIPLFIGNILWHMDLFLHKPLEFQEKTKTMMVVLLLITILKIFLNIIFVKLFGYTAAAYTTILCYFIYALIIHLISNRYMKIEIFQKGTIKYIIGITLAFTITLILNKSTNNFLTFASIGVFDLSLLLMFYRKDFALIKL
jgi:O-antigen/teichoic acid export membrane protein